ncbi:MAG: hypothetical protein HY072_04300 [Deltaproteobacteria bacterium]|nr:hypothetical protein [Deltaproteobacteria bacterium]
MLSIEGRLLTNNGPHSFGNYLIKTRPTTLSMSATQGEIYTDYTFFTRVTEDQVDLLQSVGFIMVEELPSFDPKRFMMRIEGDDFLRLIDKLMVPDKPINVGRLIELADKLIDTSVLSEEIKKNTFYMWPTNAKLKPEIDKLTFFMLPYDINFKPYENFGFHLAQELVAHADETVEVFITGETLIRRYSQACSELDHNQEEQSLGMAKNRERRHFGFWQNGAKLGRSIVITD